MQHILRQIQNSVFFQVLVRVVLIDGNWLLVKCNRAIPAIFVKPQQWPTPSESIAIYCVRKLVSCITHLQSCAKVDIWNKKKKLRTVAKIKPQGYKNCRLPKFSANVTPPLYTATTLFNEPRSQRPFGTSDWQNYSSRLAWLLSQAVTWFATDCNVQRKKSSFAKVKWSNSIKINTPVAVQ